MGKEVLFIAFSDIQIRDWKNYSTNHSRLLDNGKILKKIYKSSKKYNVPVLFGGDLYDNNVALSNLELYESMKWFKKFDSDGIKIFAISGNHDQSEKNTMNNKSPNYIKTLSLIFNNFWDLDNSHHTIGDILIAGIPYYSSTDDLIEAIKIINKQTKKSKAKRKILLLHTHLPGTQEPSGLKLDSDLPSTFFKLLKPWGLVLSGHIHKPQKVYKNTLMMGATHHQRTSDEGCKMGYWLIYDDLSYKFIPAKAPEFIYVESDEEIKEDKNFYIKVSEEAEESEDVQVSDNFKPNSRPELLAKEYIKSQNIKSKSKLKTLKNYLEL